MTILQKLYGNFRQGFLTESEVRKLLWEETNYSAHECCAVAERWANELEWEEVAADYRIASRN